MTNSRFRVGIIGGGLSGLATAAHLTLAQRQVEVTVLESSARTGGVIATSEVDGFKLDHGADMFATKPSHALELCQQLGLANQLITPRVEGRGAMILCRGRLVPIPDGFVLMRATKLWPMLTTPLLSPLGKLRWLCERWVATSQDSAKTGAADHLPAADTSVADFVRHRMGDEVLQRIVSPLVAGIYTADIEKLSLRATMGPIARMVDTHGSLAAATRARRKSGDDATERGSKGARYGQFRSLAGGMQEFVDGIAAALPAGTVRTSQRVGRIRRRSPSGETPAPWQALTPAGWQAFDHLVLATPAAAAARLLADAAPIAATELAAIESASTAIVVLVLKRSDIRRPVETFGFVVPPAENRRLLAGSFASAKFDGRCPEDHVIVRCFMGGSLQPELLDCDDARLIEVAREELEDLIGLEAAPVVSKVVRWENAMPQYHVGHAARVARIKDAIAPVPGLTMTCNALDGVGIAPLVGAAKDAAAEVIAAAQHSVSRPR